MNNEKMKILKLLEEGKITATEAAKLIESLTNATPNFNTNSNIHTKDSKIEETFSKVGSKLNDFIKDVTPIAKKYSKIALEKTSDLADKVSHSLNNASNQIVNKVKLEKFILEENSNLSITSLNGAINLKGYNGDSLTLNISYKSKIKNPYIELSKSDNFYKLEYNRELFDYLEIQGYLPYSKFKDIEITNMNASVELYNIDTSSLKVTNQNSPITLSDLVTNTLEAKNSNSLIQISNIKSNQKLSVDNSNSPCNISNIDSKEVQVETSNANIILNNMLFNNHSDYNIKLNTSNATINIDIPQDNTVDFNIKGTSTLGTINVHGIGLTETVTDKFYKEYKSINGENKIKKANIILETTNGSITVK